MSATMDQIERLIATLERIASNEEKMLEQGERSLKGQRDHLEELRIHTDYLLRSERSRLDLDTLTKLFYTHTFKKDGFDLVRGADAYRTVAIDEKKWKADTDEIEEASKKLREALDKFAVETKILP